MTLTDSQTASMRCELLVGSAAFWDRAQADMAQARQRVFVQAMTFEGDAAGQSVAQAIAASPARDRRVLVDDYTRHNLNDTMLRGARDPALLAEAEATWAMFEQLIAQGAGVRVTDPIGRNPLRFAARNHKKLLIMDDTCWLGGINFSDHNFAWHDIMLRIEDRAVADWLAGEFDADWEGVPDFRRASFGRDLTLLSLDGETNRQAYGEMLELLGNARSSIEMLSAYPTAPFTDAMIRAARRGVAVTLHTPRSNNKPIVRDYLLATLPGTGVDLRLIDRMTHVKAALVDDAVLLLGSSNFDFVSYHQNNEFIALLRDQALIADARERLFRPAQAEGAAPRAEELGGWPRLKARLAITLAERLVARIRPGERIAEWSRPGR